MNNCCPPDTRCDTRARSCKSDPVPSMPRWAGLGAGLLWVLAAGALCAPPGALADVPSFDQTTPSQPARAVFSQERVTAEARQLADWVVDSGDSRALPFVLVDKRDARVYVFHADGRLRGVSAALLGLATGDDAVPGIGERSLSSIRPEERTTPSGRFVASLGRNLHGVNVLWVDYDGAISLHPVITSNLKEHRAQRLATPTSLDNRISYGCINVPADFFRRVVEPAFKGTPGVVYVLPETRSVRQEFDAYDVNDRPARTVSLSKPPEPTRDASIAPMQAR